MTPEQLRNVASFVDALNDLADNLDLHLYGGGGVYVDDASNSSIVSLSYDSEDGYSIEHV